MHKLAIVIPAYKIEFFEYTLDSLSAQTCKDFTLYIGDDNSPSDFKSLISRYEHKIDIVYQRFGENLGGKDLVAQWERCISLTKGEPWLWLFSDDDIMGPQCVECFYNEINGGKDQYDLYHFNVDVIDFNGNVVLKQKSYPDVIDSESFYRGKASAKTGSFVVEYIFSRDAYEKAGGFVKFDMAWGSDIATWVKIGYEKGIKTIQDELVYWRSSNQNITPNHNKDVVEKKINIDVLFIKWVNDFFNTRSIRRFNAYAFFRTFFYYSIYLDRYQVHNVICNAVDKEVLNPFMGRTFIFFYPVIKGLKFCKLKMSI